MLFIPHRLRPALLLAGVLFAQSTPATAADGCTVLLCLAGNWRGIPLCVPPVREALRDMARGRFPTCDGLDSAQVALEDCPLQYRIAAPESATPDAFSCRYTGAIETRVEGVAWSRSWWNYEGDSVTEWSPAARAAFSSSGTPIDDRFDRDYAEWLRAEEERRAQQPIHSDNGG